MCEAWQFGARVDVGSLPPTRPKNPAKRLIKKDNIINLIKMLERMNEQNINPEDFFRPLGNLLDGVQHKGAFLENVRFYRARKLTTPALFTNVSELGYPPEKLARKGRLNREADPVLYPKKSSYGPARAGIAPSGNHGDWVIWATM